MLKQSLVLDYLKWADRETEKLFQTVRLPKPKMSTAIAEVPAFSQKRDEERFVASALQGGYVAANLSLLKYSQGLYRPKFLQLLKQELPITTVHGGSIKREIKTGISYKKFLVQDLENLKKIDNKKTVTINFDLYAGHPLDLDFKKSFKSTRNSSLKGLCGILSIPSRKVSENALIEKIISDISSVFRDSGYGITLELPGSKGWSMFPEIANNHLKLIDQLRRYYLPESKLCIDVGHVLTWSRGKEGLDKYLKILTNFQSLIGMLHISSAGSWTESFRSLYASVYKKFPVWHTAGLDMALAVCEKQQIEFISKVRKICSDHNILEVSETRTHYDAIADYFGQFDLKFIDNSQYFTNLIKQGVILGYATKKD